MTDKIGFIGLGNMGAGMAKSLALSGFEVAAFDLSEKSRAVLKGIESITLCETLTDAVSCKTLVLMLPNSTIVQDVLIGSGQVISSMPENNLIIDMGSSDPDIYSNLVKELQSKHTQIIDAPVSGSPSQAASGALTIMAGGRCDLIDRAMPLLNAMGDRVFHTGTLGTGQTMKAINNLMTAGGLILAIEAMLMAKESGLDERQVNDILNVSTGYNDATRRKVDSYILSETFDSGFALSLLAKDLRIAASIARKGGLNLLLSKHAIEMIQNAEIGLDRGVDHTEIAKWLDIVEKRPCTESLQAGH